jgi:hypothetical protein
VPIKIYILPSTHILFKINMSVIQSTRPPPQENQRLTAQFVNLCSSHGEGRGVLRLFDSAVISRDTLRSKDDTESTVDGRIQLFYVVRSSYSVSCL